MDRFLQDVKYSFRLLMRRPGFTAAAVLTLALGIGANTAIFSVVHGVLLDGLPYRDAGRLVVIWNDFGEQGQSLPAASPPDYQDYKRWAQLFEGFTEFGGGPPFATLTGDGEPERVNLGIVDTGFFDFLGQPLFLGREFTAEEARPGGPAVAILTHALWERRYGADPGIIGKSIQISSQSTQVVGVLAPDFRLHLPSEIFGSPDSDIWAPQQVDMVTIARNLTMFTVLGRLKSGVTLAQGQAEMDGIAARLRDEHLIHKSSDLRIRIVPLQQDVTKAGRASLLLLMGAVVFVLMIACANVANLLLARVASRERELAVRVAMGASRGRIVSQLLTESLVLASLGGAAGLLLAVWGLDLLLSSPPASLPRVENIGLSPVVLAFSSGLTLLTAVLFGLAPALQVARPDVNEILREGGRSPGQRSRRRLRNLVVVAEVALSLVLLIGAGLLIRSLYSLQQVHPGYEVDNVLTFQLTLAPAKYPSQELAANFHGELVDRLRELPGVEAAGHGFTLPMTGQGPLTPYAYDDETERNWESLSAEVRNVSAGYFEVLGARLLSGRWFNEGDDNDSRLALIVDDTLAERAWPGEEAVGRRLKITRFLYGGPNNFGMSNEWGEVVGVVQHMRVHSLAETGRSQIYIHYRQQSFPPTGVVLRTSMDPAVLAGSIRRVVREMDPDLPLAGLRPMRAYVDDSLAGSRFSMALTGIFALVALVLASVGLYGVLSYAASQRTHEIGIRLAMGATRGDIFRLVVGQGMALAGLGLGVGLLASVWMGGLLSSQLYGVSPTDLPTFAGVTVVLAAVAFLASYLPARRAMRVDPMVALRYE